MNGKFYIKKMIRDDGNVLQFDDKEILLNQDNSLLTRADPDTTAINYTEADGGELIAQKNPSVEQKINGLIVPKTTPYWTLVTRLNAFFKINHIYKIIYIKKDGGMFMVTGAWISEGLQIPPTAYEEYAVWSVALTIGHDVWREYSEDEQGHETYANSVMLPLLSQTSGGEEWDEIGTIWDEIGEKYNAGSGTVRTVDVTSATNIYPIWVVSHECVRPQLQNNTTDTIAVYDGNVAEGQTLVVDFEAGTAMLDGAVVTRNLSGIVWFKPGENLVGFNSDGGTAKDSVIKWNNIIG